MSAFVIAYFPMPQVKRLVLRSGVMDELDQRKVHLNRMRRLGGIVALQS
jgi:UDP-N-acetylmuramyl pentapeptide phosphotransferase/UDP-N-acetylglucosamine-1-phosphate transferase